MAKRVGPTSLQFFGRLKWLDGRNLLETMQPYRRELFTQAFDSFDDQGRPRYNLVLAGRAKEKRQVARFESAAALFTLTIRRSVQGSDCFILANDADQAGDDLSLAKKLIAYNPELGR